MRTTRRFASPRRITGERKAIKMAARDLGDAKLGLSLDNVGLIEQVEGSLHR
jgi:hypothetical protein